MARKKTKRDRGRELKKEEKNKTMQPGEERLIKHKVSQEEENSEEKEKREEASRETEERQRNGEEERKEGTGAVSADILSFVGSRRNGLCGHQFHLNSFS